MLYYPHLRLADLFVYLDWLGWGGGVWDWDTRAVSLELLLRFSALVGGYVCMYIYVCDW